MRSVSIPKVNLADAVAETEGEKRNLLLGNGFSMAVDQRFA